MTLNEVYTLGKKKLRESKIENADYDNMCIFEKCFNLKRHDLAVHRNELADEIKCQEFFDYINQREKGRPLQYILQKWEFCGKTFTVGEGVLIPRDDTEVLVNVATKYLKNIKNAKILDLCAGSGAVSIVLGDRFKDAEIIAVEISDDAIKYLKENISLNKIKNVRIEKYDILKGSKDFYKHKFDVIVSNPPYIKTEDINKLQLEVQQEPKLALDGGRDGLTFYRAIANKWKQVLKKQGIICVEIGKGQTEDIKKIFYKEAFVVTNIVKDINNIDRVVAATAAHS